MSLEAGRMRRLIDDLLSLNRIELNEHVPPSGRSDLNGVVRDVVTALAPLAQAERISVSVDAPPDLPPVAGQRDELIQLFQNLLHNAIKYGKPGGHVWVKLGTGTSRLGREVYAAVKDDGEGIPHDAIPRLTERFYRVDVKRSREKGGTGLGLAIVKHIVNRHRGRLLVESEPGEGSTFTVSLPAELQPASASVTEVL
jgi:two-component system phosphate regulon sensor histidine kinase PhoR